MRRLRMVFCSATVLLLAIPNWITATGSVFQTSGPLTDGYIVVRTQ